MAAMREIAQVTGWDLREAKRLMLHFTTTPGVCHFDPCATKLQAVVGPCAVCGRVNVDWLR